MADKRYVIRNSPVKLQHVLVGVPFFAPAFFLGCLGAVCCQRDVDITAGECVVFLALFFGSIILALRMIASTMFYEYDRRVVNWFEIPSRQNFVYNDFLKDLTDFELWNGLVRWHVQSITWGGRIPSDASHLIDLSELCDFFVAMNEEEAAIETTTRKDSEQ